MGLISDAMCNRYYHILSCFQGIIPRRGYLVAVGRLCKVEPPSFLGRRRFIAAFFLPSLWSAGIYHRFLFAEPAAFSVLPVLLGTAFLGLLAWRRRQG